MQRKATSNTRGPNAEERRYHHWLKTRLKCSACQREALCNVHHCEGATFKHNKVLCGHWFCLSLCDECDSIITIGNKNWFREAFGPQSELALRDWFEYTEETANLVPLEVKLAVSDWGR